MPENKIEKSGQLGGLIAEFVKALVQQEFQQQLPVMKHDFLRAKYMYHYPMDDAKESSPPLFGPNIEMEGESIPIPPPMCRPGYSPDDDEKYLEWGKYDHDRIMTLIEQHHGIQDHMSILDWGCSSGRVLRHFIKEQEKYYWQLNGTDIQAFLVEWMRRYFPNDIKVMTGSTFPHLPFKDSSLDVIYGISVFTHTKYLWDFWLAELSRVLKPGGLCIQTVQCEFAWDFYHTNKELDWVKDNHPPSMLEKPEIDTDFFFYGNPEVSQTFYKEEIIKKYWNRYMTVLELLPPPEKFSFQNWIVLKNS